MGGDYTRVTFQPAKAYTSVRSQQGRVSLDADFNELGDIHDRRWRAETIDIIGRAVVPGSTPDAFLVAIAGGQITIGPGRAYVDGILVECRGSGPAVYDASLGEQRGGNPLPFAQQPFFYQPVFPGQAPFPNLSGGASDLVYLDVWSREVSVLEDPDLQETALGGPDTTTRVQAAWQVKVLANSGATSCSDTPPAWTALTAPSTVRLSSAAPPGAPSLVPCVIEPEGGYTGLENRLYRVEVQTVGGGTLGSAVRPQFTWSRDNASSTARVTAPITAAGPGQSTLTLGSTGRDEFVRFAVGDYVELLDDFVEFAMRETGRGGFIGRIVAPVDYANAQITVDQDWTTFAVVAGRHPRIRRWDVDEDNPGQAVLRDCTPNVAIPLERGITITFDNDPAATVHAGDYWVFSARTATGTIEELQSEPPRGILHHFGKLALVSGQTVLQDCRDEWPPTGGCCTEVVRPGESIQAAIDRLPPAGGCVCLKPGLHAVPATIRIARSDVILHGETQGAVIRVTTGPTVVRIEPAPGTTTVSRVMLHDLRLEAPAAGGIGVEVAGGVDVAIERCHLFVALPTGGFADGIGAGISRSLRVAIRDCTVENMLFGLWSSRDSREIDVLGNRLVGPVYRRPLDTVVIELPFGLIGVWLEDTLGACRVEHNEIRGYWSAIRVEDGASGSIVARNAIVRPATAGSEPPDPFFGVLLPIPGRPDVPRYYAIDVTAAACLIAENDVSLHLPSHGGIRVGGRECRAVGNRVVSMVDPPADPAPLGIVVGPIPHDTVAACEIARNTLRGHLDGIVVTGQVTTQDIRDNDLVGPFTGPQISVDGVLIVAAECTVGGNRITGFTRGVHLLGFGGHRVEDNRITACGLGIAARDLRVLAVSRNAVVDSVEAAIVGDDLRDSSFDDNELVGFGLGGLYLIRPTGVRVTRNRTRTGPAGIGAALGADLHLLDNTVEEMTSIAILVEGTEDVRISRNRVRRCGNRDDLGLGYTAGIVAAAVGPLAIESCELTDIGRGVAGVAAGETYGIRAITRRATVRDNQVTLSPELAPANVQMALQVTGLDWLDVTGNVLSARGPRRLVALRAVYSELPLDVIFSNNRCVHAQPNTAPAHPESTVLLQLIRRLTAMGNHVTGTPRAQVSLDFQASAALIAAGNITSGTVANLPANRRPANYADLNMITT